MPTPLDIPLHFLADCSEATLKSFNLSCLNRLDNLRKARAELDHELIEQTARLEVAQWFIANRPAIIEALRAEVMSGSLTVGPQSADRPARRSEAA